MTMDEIKAEMNNMTPGEANQYVKDRLVYECELVHLVEDFYTINYEFDIFGFRVKGQRITSSLGEFSLDTLIFDIYRSIDEGKRKVARQLKNEKFKRRRGRLAKKKRSKDRVFPYNYITFEFKTFERGKLGE